MTGASSGEDRATAAEPDVSALRDGIPSADERELFVESFFACWRAAIAGAFAKQVRKGFTPAVMAHRVGWTEAKMRRLMAVPRTMHSIDDLSNVCWSMNCEPEMVMHNGITYITVIPLAEKLAARAQAIEAATAGETREAGLDAKHESAVAKPCAPTQEPNS